MVLLSDSLTEEEPEGLDQEVEPLWQDYPLDTLMIRNENRTIHDVLRRIQQGQFVMDPDFQRDFIWHEDKQSKLIESVLMRIPLPVFYLAEDIHGHMVVVDGLQRLSTFKNFVDGGLRLRLPHQSELNRKRFVELSPRLQNRIEDCNLTLYVLDAKAPEQARLDIFERVNGGAPLTRQQMRNCLYMGAATRFLKQETEREEFTDATGGSLKPSTMRDREFVNRFCGFQLFPLEDYRGDMDEFLALTLKRMNGMSAEQLGKLSEELRRGLSNNFHVFKEHAFRKHTGFQQKRSVINASLWDVMAIGLSKYPEDKVQSLAPALQSAFYALMGNSAFIEAISYGTNQVNRVQCRFALARNMLREVFGDYPN